MFESDGSLYHDTPPTKEFERARPASACTHESCKCFQDFVTSSALLIGFAPMWAKMLGLTLGCTTATQVCGCFPAAIKFVMVPSPKMVSGGAISILLPSSMHFRIVFKKPFNKTEPISGDDPWTCGGSSIKSI